MLQSQSQQPVHNMQVACAFNVSHKMPISRYVWHLVRCPDKKSREASGLPIYYCSRNRLHIFLNRQKHQAHEKVCAPKTPGEPGTREKKVGKLRPFG